MGEKFTSRVGYLIRNFRIASDMTQKELADKSGYSTPYFICFSNKVIVSNEISRLRFVNVIYFICNNSCC